MLGTTTDQGHIIWGDEMGRFLDHLICTAKNSVERGLEKMLADPRPFLTETAGNHNTVFQLWVFPAITGSLK